ncbi:GTPase [Neorhodopirellula pilleata]|uniref:GTP-binding protein n=1 Tax=Neorhodopirellula pilleata TaxID=2714738 RepID=A0A5C6AB12_9BACT|nr:GTPase [Neorhodopirellula pilleata]TWT96590.1 GTP-binding protein [Neorhodopirellula pilleata]
MTSQLMDLTERPTVLTQTIVVIGKESVGKSQLLSSLTGRSAGESNFRGSTVSVQRYRYGETTLVDTPGILRQSDTDTTRRTLDALQEHDQVLLVVQATQLDSDLAEMLPLVAGKRGAIIVTFWDKVQPVEAALEAIERLSKDVGVDMHPLDARSIMDRDVPRIATALQTPKPFLKSSLTARAGWRIEPKPGWLEHRVIGPTLAIMLLILPALATIFGANQLAEWLHPLVAGLIEPLVAHINASWPTWLGLVLTASHGDFGYGLLNMGPFLFVWALPTVLLFSLILGVYKASGLIDRMNVALHPLVRPLGLSGRDVVRVMMGFPPKRLCRSCSHRSARMASFYWPVMTIWRFQ